MGKLTGKTALVTGAGTGLGRGIALTLAKEGATVVLNGRREDKLEDVKREIGDSAIVLAGDASDEQSANELIETLKEKTGGKLDILVNNAGGVSVMGRVDQLSTEDFQKMLSINTMTQLSMTKACLPLLRESGEGKLISITSTMVNYFVEGMGAYSATKAAAEALMKTVAVEEKENGVQVNIFDPINVASEGNPQGEHDPLVIAKTVAELAASAPLYKQGEIIKPEV